MCLLFYVDAESVQQFQNQVSIIQRDAVWWLHSVVPKMLTHKLTDWSHWLVYKSFIKS